MRGKAAKGGGEPSAQSNSVDFGHLRDSKLEKGKKKLLQEAESSWRGPSHKERKEAAQEGRKAIKRKQMRETEAVSWRKRAGGLCIVLFLCGVGLFQFLSTIFGFLSGPGFVTVDVQDTTRLKEVLFGGQPWFVYCVNDETQGQRLPKVLEESSGELRRNLGLRMAVLHCWDKTASGRSVAQRFKLKGTPPLAFVVANGDKPQRIDLVGMSKPEDLEKKVKPALKIEPRRIDSLKKWSTLCTSRRACVVVGHRNQAQRDHALNLLRPLMPEYRRVKIVTLDTSFWRVKLDEGLLKRRPSEKTATILCLARPDSGEGDPNVTHAGDFLQELEARSASAFLRACDERQNLVDLGDAPRIEARPSKPKKDTPAPTPTPRPRPASGPAPAKPRGHQDRVGSRAKMETADEALFEAVEEEAEEADSMAGGESSAGEEDTEGESTDGSSEEEEVEL